MVIGDEGFDVSGGEVFGGWVGGEEFEEELLGLWGLICFEEGPSFDGEGTWVGDGGVLFGGGEEGEGLGVVGLGE